jgi:hypothetical protein
MAAKVGSECRLRAKEANMYTSASSSAVMAATAQGQGLAQRAGPRRWSARPGEFALGLAAFFHEHLGQPLAHRGELGAAVLLHPVAPLEAQRQDEVEEFEQVAMGRGVFGQLAEELEELLAAPGFVVELHQQAALGPHLVAPRGVGGGFVEEGAQGVPGGDQVFVGTPWAWAFARTRRWRGPGFTQALRVGVVGLAELGHQVEQRVGGGDEGLRPDSQSRVARSTRSKYVLAGCAPWAAAARAARAPGEGMIRVLSDGGWAKGRRAPWCRSPFMKRGGVQARIAHRDSSRAGKSPVT